MMKRFFFLSLLTCASLVQADVDLYLKKALHKEGNHSLKNIDFIYVINLDERPQKWEWTKNQLSPYGITPYRFSAVNGWLLSLEAINDIGLKFSPEMEEGVMGTCYPPAGNFAWLHQEIKTYGRTYFSHCMGRGAMGIVLSHLSILQDAYDSGYETIWVMEDDIEVKQDPNILPTLIEKLDTLVGKEHWDVLFTDRDTRDSTGKYVPAAAAAKRPDFASPNDFITKTKVSPEFRRIGSRYGAYSMILRRSGIYKILQFLKAHQVFLPYDMEYTLPPGIKLYTVLEDVVQSYTKALSDNGMPYYLLD